ncbi:MULTISPECIES: neutral/alkaline non-lysosomal ceramidase N-terminal domain-containing protein [unclassified Haladaptatus]|uniref:neutral/alkaline non-lysosomal ceramidase N-terminal domain-containing protein n=1 Tax=unclassified Haladaptatus TaxID=2622732 RepID=UPI0023E78D63|nr:MULTISPECIES: neutral/alkaline non-lysosomal ceramidase N-terminal domain-containing protein [unclassified Haladaptatus]
MTRLRAGYAARDCTPAEPRQLSGYGPGTRKRVSTGVHSPLSAKALVFDDGTTSFALVSLDLLNVFEEFTAAVRRRVAHLELDYVLVTATHTHAAPYMPGKFLEVNPLLSYDVEVTDYVATVESATVAAIEAAHDRLEPAALSVGHAHNDTVQHNRRDESGPIDPELAVLSVTTESGPDVLVVNFACHPVCTNARETLVSADWPGTLYDRVRAETDMETLFVNGAAAEINPRDSRSRRSGDDLYDYMAGVGEAIAETALTALDDAREGTPLSTPEISISHEPLSLAIQHLDSRDQLQARYDDLTAEIERLGGGGDRPDFSELQSADDERADLLLDRWYAEEKLRLDDWGVDAFETRLSHVELGPLAFLTIPGEAFVQHGLDFKAAATADTLFVAGYADDYVGYFPTQTAFPDGGYEVATCKFSPEAMATFREVGFELVSE